jgi:hypothetical protein
MLGLSLKAGGDEGVPKMRYKGETLHCNSRLTKYILEMMHVAYTALPCPNLVSEDPKVNPAMIRAHIHDRQHVILLSVWWVKLHRGLTQGI